MPAQAQEFKFIFSLKNETFTQVVEAKTWGEALLEASDHCYTFYSKNQHVSERLGLAIIDTCVNPKEVK